MMSDSTSSDFSEEETSIDWLLSQEGNHLLCRVEEDYIEDNFNLYGLSKIIPNFRDSIRLLLSDSASVEGCLDEGWVGPTYEHLLDLYGLIHARYILTAQGLNKMRRKFQNNVFGSCPESSQSFRCCQWDLAIIYDKAHLWGIAPLQGKCLTWRRGENF